jgi:small nuclear ribonucleoprotein (snRNP)-like protein
MTIRKINEIINYLLYVLNEGFVQKLQDYLVTIQNNSSNLVLTKEITDRLISDLEAIMQTDIPTNMDKILYSSVSKPFTDRKHYDELIELKEANYSDYSTQYSSLVNIITRIDSDVKQNLIDIENLKTVFKPFLDKDYSELQGENNAIFSVVLNNIQSYRNLKLLNKELNKWDQGLMIYQQILSSDTPRSLEIVEVSEGSIEILLNLDADTVTSLIDLFKTGLEAFGAYLTYKEIKNKLTKPFQDNKKLMKGEEGQEKLLLENVEEAIVTKLKQQAEASKQENIEALDKKIDIVVKLLTDQIVKGNNIKLISAPEEKPEIENLEEEKEQIFVNSQKVFKKLDETSKQKLLDQYEYKESS